MHRFKATVQLGGEEEAWMLSQIPRTTSEALGARGRISVTGAVNGYPIKTSIFPNGNGTHHMTLNKAMQKGANAAAGSQVIVELEAAPKT